MRSARPAALLKPTRIITSAYFDHFEASLERSSNDRLMLRNICFAIEIGEQTLNLNHAAFGGIRAAVLLYRV